MNKTNDWQRMVSAPKFFFFSTQVITWWNEEKLNNPQRCHENARKDESILFFIFSRLMWFFLPSEHMY
jgi:hypothetical protein